MALVDRVLLGNSLRSWSSALAYAGLLLLTLWLLERFFLRRLVALAAKTPQELDDLVGKVAAATRFWILAFPALTLGSLRLALSPEIRSWLGAAAWIGLWMQVALWADALTGFWLERSAKRKADAKPGRAVSATGLRAIVRVCLFTIVGLLALDHLPGVQITALIGSLGIAGIAVGLAMQNILADLFASLSIVLDEPFAVGDFVDVGGEKGNVEHIGLKTTRMRSPFGEQLIIGNSDLLRSRIRNFGRMEERCVVFTVGVSCRTQQETLERIPAILQEEIASQPHTRFARAHLKALGAYTFDFEVMYYVLSPDYVLYMDTQQAINLAILRRFAAEGIELPYPTQRVYVAQPERGNDSAQPEGQALDPQQ